MVGFSIENDSPPCNGPAKAMEISSDVARKAAADTVMSMTNW